MRVRQETFRLVTRVWLVLVGAGVMLMAGLSAHAAYRALADHPDREASTVALTGYETEDHFPGAALLYASLSSADTRTRQQGETAAPATGVTGTIDLPSLPIPAPATQAALAADTAVVPAVPFTMRWASNIDRARATECLTAAIYYEAASEPDAGQSAVAQVILNRVRHPAFPATVCGVVYQGSEHAGCQFSFACDGAMMRVPARAAWARAARAAAMALAGYVYAPVGLATHYHTYAVTPAWNRSLVMTDVVGAHFFHRWKGFWGTAAAFRQVYRGGEPLPGPHPSIGQPIGAAVIAASASVAVVPHADGNSGTPGVADSGRYVTASARSDNNLPPASQVLDRWKDSGKPLF